MSFSITSYGAAQEVTGSCHLLEIDSKQVLLDCGMHQGGDAIKRLKKERFGFNVRRISAVILSHAHLDHSGLLPLLVRKGFRGPIYCTPATRNMLAIMLEDSANIYFRDLERENIGRKRAGKKLVQPDYEMEDVLAVLKQCEPLDYYQCARVHDGLQVCFHDAGHILGSAVVELTCGQGDAQKTVVFSGDLGNDTGTLMRDPDVPARADLVLMESTYGNRDHRPFHETLEEFEQILAQARHDRGVILMPAFAVGRTQELLFHLGCFYHQGKLDGWKVYLDSPMAIEVTHLYDEWIDVLAKDERRAMRHFGARTLEEFLPSLTLTPSVDDSIRLNRFEEGAIIIAGSGMCNGGRIRHHLKHRLWREDTHIVFAGYQAHGTLGRQLVDGAKTVRMFGKSFAVKATMHTLGGFSAHAGRTQLLQWAMGIGDQPEFRLVHGEHDALVALAHELRQRDRTVTIAEPGVIHDF